MNYSYLPTVGEAFARFVQVPLVYNNEKSLTILKEGVEFNSETPTISALNNGNLFIATQKQKNANEAEYSVDLLGSNEFNFTVQLNRGKDYQNTITTTIKAINATKQDPKTQVEHTFNLSSGVPMISKTRVIEQPKNQIGLAAPVFKNIYNLTSLLEYFYSTSKTLMTPSSKEGGEELAAFWNSWGDALKAAIVSAGGVVGGVIGGLATGGIGAVGGAAGGAAIGEKIWNMLD